MTAPTADLVALAIEYVDAMAARDKAEQTAREAADLLLERLAVGDKVELPGTDGEGVQVVAGRAGAFDPVLARRLPDDLLANISEMVPTMRLAEKYLPPALFDQCRRPAGRPSIRRL